MPRIPRRRKVFTWEKEFDLQAKGFITGLSIASISSLAMCSGSRKHIPVNLVIPSPFPSNGLLYIASGYVGDQQRPVWAVKPGATGDISLKDEETSNEFIAWFQPKAGPYNPSPIVYQGHYYTLFDFGFLTCHDAMTGIEVFGKRRFPDGASFTASPWAFNGKLFCLSEEGRTYVVNPGSEFEVSHTNDLNELCLSTPAVSQGHLLIRTASRLYCFTNKENPR